MPIFSRKSFPLRKLRQAVFFDRLFWGNTLYIYVYIYIYWCCGVNKWSTFSFVAFLRFSKMFFFLQGEWDILKKIKLKNQKIQQNSRVDKWSTFASKNSKQNVDHLLTLLWTTYWPYFLTQKCTKKHCPKLAETPIFIVFSEKHTSKQQKNKKAKTLWFWRLQT